MKIAFLGDSHFGARGDSQHFHEFFDRFYTNIFFPYLIKNNIKTVIQLGDIFDRRKYSNHYTLAEAKRYFFSRFDELNIELITLLGNHDLYYRESLSISSSELFLKQFKNVTVIDNPTRLEQFDITVIPWICKENYAECLNIIKNDISHMCVGHFEVEGFKMYQSSILSEHGLSSKIFSNYERVLSGHYHHASKRGNIEYIGTPYEMTWQDFDDQKGFRVYNTETRTLDTVENTYSIYCKLVYDDSGENDVVTSTYLDKTYLQNVTGKYVKIQVKNKTNPYLFDLFLDQVYQHSPIDVSLIEEVLDLEIESEVDENDDTLTITYKYIDSIGQQELDKNRLKNMMSNLYNEAMQVE
jgi:DNA repair exonuclease SbcCD nuclease subunit